MSYMYFISQQLACLLSKATHQYIALGSLLVIKDRFFPNCMQKVQRQNGMKNGLLQSDYIIDDEVYSGMAVEGRPEKI